jgi:hypothetical protein
MSEDRLSRLGALTGALFVVLELSGVGIAAGAGRPTVTIADSPSKIVRSFADPIGSGAWLGSYLELLSLAAFAVFAATLFRARRGPVAGAGLIAASAYVAIAGMSLLVGDVLQYRAGHGLGAQETLALFDLQSMLYVATWGIAAGVLALAPVSGWMRRSALAIALLLLVGAAAPKAGPAQFPTLLFFLWVLVTSVVLARRPKAGAMSAVPAHA